MIPFILKRLKRLGIECELCPTRAPGHATELARQAVADGVKTVIVCGGDGTVNETAAGLVGSDTALGIIPAGSGNGLARHLGIPIDTDLAIRVIAADNIIRADYGTANGQPFFCTFGVGFDAAVSERCTRQRRRGIMMYLKNGINEFIKFSPEEYTIEVNGKIITERAFLVVACNASQYGNNAYVAPHASITDGELDLTIVHADNLISQAIVGIDMLMGIIGHNTLADTIRCKSATIRRKTPGAAHLDGDAVTLPEEITVTCQHSQINLYAPTRDTQFRPLITPLLLGWRDTILTAARLLHLRR